MPARWWVGTLALLFFAGCGTGTLAPPVDDPAARRQLSDAFLRFRQNVQEGNADSLAADLSRDTRQWLEDMRYAARSEPLNFLKDRPFHEALCILALRVERRLNPGFDDKTPSLLRKLVIENAPVRKTLLKTELGEPRIRGEAGEIGLREAPNVPVFHFSREGQAWKFHLVKSLPLILQGAESLARQRKPTRVEQAIYILETFGGRPVLPEDLTR